MERFLIRSGGGAGGGAAGSAPKKKRKNVDGDAAAEKAGEEAEEVAKEAEEADAEADEEEEDGSDPSATRKRAKLGREAKEAEMDATASPSVPEPTGWEALDSLDVSWRQQLAPETRKPYYSRLRQFVDAERRSQTVFPPAEQELMALAACGAYEDVKVVIIGQDPYHGPGQAHGLAFSVQQGVATPPSLRNMVKEAMSDVGISKPNHGSLMAWAEQGVLLLNTVLTVRARNANSHKKQGWEQFTDAIIQHLNRREDGLVFLLWGKPAQTKCRSINTSRHRVIQCAHPSPLSATKTNTPFIGSRCFSRCNDALRALGKAPIEWSL